jgi:hypothetical protein
MSNPDAPQGAVEFLGFESRSEVQFAIAIFIMNDGQRIGPRRDVLKVTARFRIANLHDRHMHCGA